MDINYPVKIPQERMAIYILSKFTKPRKTSDKEHKKIITDLYNKKLKEIKEKFPRLSDSYLKAYALQLTLNNYNNRNQSREFSKTTYV